MWEAVIHSLQEDEVRTGKPVLGILSRKARGSLQRAGEGLCKAPGSGEGKDGPRIT